MITFVGEAIKIPSFQLIYPLYQYSQPYDLPLNNAAKSSQETIHEEQDNRAWTISSWLIEPSKVMSKP